MAGIHDGFDEVVHARNRLQVCALLHEVEALSFPTLCEALDVQDYVLSKHLKVLVDAGYVESTKRRELGRRQTWVSLTPAGRAAYLAHLAALRRIVGPALDTREAAD